MCYVNLARRSVEVDNESRKVELETPSKFIAHLV